jgi:hypothetical protein
MRRAAERIVSDHFEGTVSLRIEHLVPDRVFNVVARLRTVTAPSHVPATFIVKAAAATAVTGAEQLLNDWAALRLLTDSNPDGVPLGPCCYGGDRTIPLVVMEDLGAGDGSPYQVVAADDPEAATESLLAYIRAIAGLHTHTRGRHEAYARLRRDLGPLPPPKPLYHDPWSDAKDRTDDEIATAIGEYHAVLATVGVTATPGVDDEIIAVTRRVELDPGPVLALCQGDQNGLGHSLRCDGRLRLHDFGSGGFRHAFIEGLPHRITWGCIRRVPEPVIAAMDAAYQAALAESWPEVAADATFQGYATDALTRWHIFHVIWRLPDALAGDRPRGQATLRQQMIAWLDAYLAWSDQLGQVSALAGTARRLVQRLRDRWPPQTHTIDYLPAFRR